VLIRLSPAELLTLADTAGFYLPTAIEAVGASGHTLHLSVSTKGTVPGIPSLLRGLFSAPTVTVDLDFLGYHDGIAEFQARMAGPLAALLPAAANSLVKDLLHGNDLAEDAITVDSHAVMRIDPEALLENMPLPGGIKLTDAAVADGELLLHAAVRPREAW